MVRSPGSAQGKGGIHTTLPPAASRVCGNNENKNVLLSRPQLGSSEKCVLLSQAPCTSVATTHCQRGRLKDTARSATMAHAGSRLVTGHRFVNSSLAPLLPVKKLRAVARTVLHQAAQTVRPKEHSAPQQDCCHSGCVCFWQGHPWACTDEPLQSPN